MALVFRICRNDRLGPPLIALQASNLCDQIIARLRVTADDRYQTRNVMAYLLYRKIRQLGKACTHFHIDAPCGIKVCVFQCVL